MPRAGFSIFGQKFEHLPRCAKSFDRANSDLRQAIEIRVIYKMDIDAEFQRVAEESWAAIEPYLRRNVENFYRVGRLVGFATGESRDDILRAAVVLLHATLEDCLRSISSALLPNSGEASLNRVPLISCAGSRAEKFSLGKLAAHREKLVSTLIKESVDSYLRHVTFNNSNEIAEHLRELGFELAPMRGAFSTIEEMMKRRHQIVHRADYDDSGKLAEICSENVMKWADGVTKLLSQVLAQLGNKEAFQRVEKLLVQIARERGIEQ